MKLKIFAFKVYENKGFTIIREKTTSLKLNSVNKFQIIDHNEIVSIYLLEQQQIKNKLNNTT